MADQISPAKAMRAGNRQQVVLSRKVDPVYLAMARWNAELVLAGTRPAGQTQPTSDGRAYTVDGAPQPFCRPFVRVAWREGYQPGPELRFDQRDDGLHLTAVFEEDNTKRVQGALPFDVTVKSVSLRYGTDPTDLLAFTQVLQEPRDPKAGPAFKVECDAMVPLDERRARIVAALQTAGRATWHLQLEFEWVTVIPPPPPSPTTPQPERPIGWRPPLERYRPGVERLRVRDHRTLGKRKRPQGDEPAGDDHAESDDFARARLATRPELLRIVLKAPKQPQPTTRVDKIAVPRQLTAEYPKEAPENRPIFAAVDGDYVQVGWRKSAHGWYQPTPIQDTVYCLPSGYRLHVDEVTGLPSITAVLLRKDASGTLVDDLDPSQYTTRLTLKAMPEFDVATLDGLRTLIRAETSNHVKYADLVLGGYKAARFVPDPSLAGLGELFGGSSHGEPDAINPAEIFTITYEGNGEFIDALFKRLVGPGIGGTVEIDLQEPGGTTRTEAIPVSLTIRRLASIAVPWKLLAMPPTDAVDPETLMPRQIVLQNGSRRPVTLEGVQAAAIQRSPLTGRVDDWYAATSVGVSWPLDLPPQASATISLKLAEQDALFNAWDIGLLSAHTPVSDQLVLNELFDAATSGVRGWRVEVDCPPLQFFDRLSPAEQAEIQDVVAIEIELRRLGSNVVEEVRLTRDQATGPVLLSRTVADFISDRAVGRSTFEYRLRVVRLTRADAPTEWQQESGRHLSVFLR
ncbi:MAG: hypothetical protein AB7F99_05155 [Vicinamibacterales bacterium]